MGLELGKEKCAMRARGKSTEKGTSSRGRGEKKSAEMVATRGKEEFGWIKEGAESKNPSSTREGR